MDRLVPGAYDLLLTERRRRLIENLPNTLRADIENLSPEDAVEYLAREIADRFKKALTASKSDLQADQLLSQANRILESMSSDPALLETLVSVRSTIENEQPKPVLPLAQSALVTNDQRLNYHSILRSELASADHVDLICPFIGSQGLNLIVDRLAPFGSRLRILTTTYLGGTHRKAIERLVDMGATVKIAYERPDQKTALHAKAWIFKRDSGFTTATIGSSNLSPRALVDGLEGNVRLSAVDSPLVLDELQTTFDRLWLDERFEIFDKTRDGERLERSLQLQAGTSDSGPAILFDLHPYRHQHDALDALRLSRLEGKHENLIVAATGTGKTLISAFDYAQQRSDTGTRPTLLFVAHRVEILEQSRAAFQHVLKDRDFGELNGGKYKAASWRHAFATIQSLTPTWIAETDPRRFDVVIIDEFHHAEAPTYRRLLDHLRPRELVGLTATPERTDGASDLIERFGGFAYEMRLWQALDAELICPFHYYGIDDRTDLSEVKWIGGKYDEADLERFLRQSEEHRFPLVWQEICQKVETPDKMRAVAFCASIEHAVELAARFAATGITSEAIHSKAPEARADTIRRFREGRINVLCAVDLLNEGVDVPEIDVVLFLRPTESAIVFTQQLGRGLRLHSDKGVLTVLDFVGQQNRKFRMDLRFRAMTGLGRRDLEQAVKEEFPRLPAGCHIKLDRVSRDRVLQNLRQAIPTNTKQLLAELRAMQSRGAEITVDTFLKETGLEADRLYRNKRSLHGLLSELAPGEVEAPPQLSRLSKLTHVDDKLRCDEYVHALHEGGTSAHARMLNHAIHESVHGGYVAETLKAETEQLLTHLRSNAAPHERLSADLPFSIHASYTGHEISAPFRDNPASMRQGTFYVRALNLDVHLLTLRKTERHFSQTTMYRDKILGSQLVQWESQSTTSLDSPTGQRYITNGSQNLLFVRERKDDPFVCLGFAKSIYFAGVKPIEIHWELERSIPDHLYHLWVAAS